MKHPPNKNAVKHMHKLPFQIPPLKGFQPNIILFCGMLELNLWMEPEKECSQSPVCHFIA